jgi:hypothetical protein
MSILIVCESQFGNTRAVADAIAEGLLRDDGSAGGPPVSVVPVDEAPMEIPADVTSLLVGGPTHAFSMTRRETRADAVKQGAPSGHEEIGIREWIEQVQPRPDLPVYTFDTRVHVKLIPGSAAKKAAEALRERGFHKAERGKTFWVEGTPGPLGAEELEKARSWGVELADQLAW